MGYANADDCDVLQLSSPYDEIVLPFLCFFTALSGNRSIVAQKGFSDIRSEV